MRASSPAWLLSILGTLAVSSAIAQTPVRRMEGSTLSPEASPAKSVPMVSAEDASQVPYAWWEGVQSDDAPYTIKGLGQRRWNFRASLTAGYEYDDNLNLSGNNQDASGILTLQPAVGVKYGPMGSGLSFDLGYAADMEWFMDGDADDTINHGLVAGINWERGPFRLTGSLNYRSEESANIDAGARIAREDLTASVGLYYDYSEKTKFGATYSAELLSPEDDAYIGSDRQVAGVLVDYKVTPKTTLGLGGEYEHQQVERGSDSNAYRVLLRASWAATAKLTVRAVAGPEWREYDEGDSEVQPYWNVGIDYKFLDTGKTSFGFDIYRNQNVSAVVENEAYTATGIAGSLAYRPGSKLEFRTAVGYEYADYTGTTSDVSSDREDHIYFVRPSLTYAFNSWSSLSVFYQWTKNASSGEESSDFERNTAGVLMTVGY